jgi:hypothetical protein
MSPVEKRLVPLLLGVLLVGLGAGCGSQSKPRPVTPARLAITAPAPNEVTGPDVALRLDLVGGTIVPQTSNRLTPTEGHVHLYVDSKLVSMTYGLTEDLKGLAPGPHSLRAEFVAADHAPFKNAVVAAVLIRVQADQTGGG